MIYRIDVLENTKAKLIVESAIYLRDESAKNILVSHYETLGYIVNVSIEE